MKILSICFALVTLVACSKQPVKKDCDTQECDSKSKNCASYDECGCKNS